MRHDEGRVLHRPNPLIVCKPPPPNKHQVGTVWKCECGRRWKMVSIGWSWQGWRRTLGTWIVDTVRREKGIQRWASVHKFSSVDSV